MACALAAWGAFVLAFRFEGVSGGFQDLMPDTPALRPLKVFLKGSARHGHILLEGAPLAPLAPLARKVKAALMQPERDAQQAFLAPFRGHAAGLLTPGHRAALLAGDTTSVAQSSLARLYGFSPALFPYAEDPFQLAAAHVESFAEQALFRGWHLREGYWQRESGGCAYLFFPVDLGTVPEATVTAFLARARAFNRKGKMKIHAVGPPFHAAEEAERARKEINVLSGVSLVAVLALGWGLFRSWGFVRELAAALAIGFLAAVGGLLGAYPRPHVLAFVFGTSLVGLCVDYVYHARAAGGGRRIARSLSSALLTTLAALTPLFLTRMAVLGEMALFTLAGLVAVWAWVLLGKGTPPSAAGCAEEGAADARRHTRRVTLGRLVSVLLVMGLAGGLGRLTCVWDPAAFYRPTAERRAAEKAWQGVSPFAAGAFVRVPGATLQAALEQEEKVGFRGLSAFVPSLRRQRENAALKDALYRAEGTAWAAKTGLKAPPLSVKGDEGTGGFLDPAHLPEGPLRNLVAAACVPGGIVWPQAKGTAPLPAGVIPFDSRTVLSEGFRDLTATARRYLIAGAGAMLLLLAGLFRRRFWAYAGPLAAAGVATAGTMGYLGIPVTLFTLLSFFVLMGLGADYVIFHQARPSPLVRRTIGCSFLTSFVGLGALALTHFPVTRSMGAVFAIGLFFSWFFAWVWAPRAVAPMRAQPWYRARERGAGHLRLKALGLVYRLCGTGVLKAVCVPVAFCIYLRARAVRTALDHFYRVVTAYQRRHGLRVTPHRPGTVFLHVLSFAWSLVDKFDACTRRRGKIRLTVREDASYRAFEACRKAGRGAFLMASHVGTAEMLALLPRACGTQGFVPHLHAFQQMGHDRIFTEFFMAHLDLPHVTFHAVEAIGVATAAEMADALEKGAFVLMAGDRVSAGSRKVEEASFLDVPCAWPRGAFAFALLMEAPVFFVTCVKGARGAYEVHFRAAPPVRASCARDGRLGELLGAYVSFLEEETCAHPRAWHHFYDFFGAHLTFGGCATGGRRSGTA